jgi:predicted transglutaminase-like cysteine proteinase
VQAAKYQIFIGIIIVIIFCVAFIPAFISEPKKNEGWLKLHPIVLEKIELKYGPAARQRFVDWQKLMAAGKSITEQDKLREVNDFFNHNIQFAEDIVLWLKEDYWATPVELLCKGAGDCEDFAIAKYFTLLEVGVDESKLRITYVKALKLNLSHMVLTYYENPQTDPLVLDNLTSTISFASERTDLLPVYSFNGTSLWINKLKGSGRMVSDGERLNVWADLNIRMLETIF